MASFWNETFSAVKSRFVVWNTVSNENEEISDVALDYLNQARRWLWKYRPWSPLVKIVALTVDSNKQATLPSDCGRLLRILDDTDGDGKAENFYYKDAQTWRGYKEIDDYDKDTGHTKKIQFFNTPTSPYIKYVQALDDFTGTGTEYLFFDSGLLLRTAQWLALQDKGTLDGNEFQAINDARMQALQDFEHMVQNNNANNRHQVNDSNGNAVYLPNSDLDGSFSERAVHDKENSYLAN